MILSAVVVLASLMILMAGLWTIATSIRNGAIADVGWGSGFILGAVLFGAIAPRAEPTGWVMVAMVAVWGARLTWFIWKHRVAGGRPEDARYAEFRKKWGANAGRNFFGFFQLQALLIVAALWPVALVFHGPGGAWTGFGVAQGAGVALWLAAFCGEAIADRQLARFKAAPENRGRVCDTGLWRYSRHPNYFFEWLIWVGLAVMASTSAWGWTSFVSPALMLWLLTSVTGIPLAEAQSLKNRGDAFRRYQRTTSPFIPWFPRKETI